MNEPMRHQDGRITISTPGGAVTGRVRDDDSCEFLGIPFATARRFGSPHDIVTWDAAIEATAHGPISPQEPGMLEQMLGAGADTMNEDCLTLGIFAPEVPREGVTRPVLFWIHGGAYTNGAGSLPWYDGSRLAARGAVVVTINYRLGALGYLGRDNMGTLDQISALRWVSRNIEAFGGNPDNVTIFGESAGGSAVVSLMSSPDARGLFHRAWAMSPSINQLRTIDRADEVTSQFLSEAKVDSIERAAELPLEDVLAAQARVLAIPCDHYDIFAPVAGGAGLPTDILGEASRSPVPFVVGTTRDENRLFSAFDPTATSATSDTWVKFSEKVFGSKAAAARTVYENRRPGETPGGLISAVRTDTAFRQPAMRLAEARARDGHPTWMYWFTWATPAFGGVLGSCHALDVPFAFDNLGAPGADMFTGDGPERQDVADAFASEIVGLAAHGHPSWAQFDIDRRTTLVLNSPINLVDAPEDDIRSLFV